MSFETSSSSISFHSRLFTISNSTNTGLEFANEVAFRLKNMPFLWLGSPVSLVLILGLVEICLVQILETEKKKNGAKDILLLNDGTYDKRKMHCSYRHELCSKSCLSQKCVKNHTVKYRKTNSYQGNIA